MEISIKLPSPPCGLVLHVNSSPFRQSRRRAFIVQIKDNHYRDFNNRSPFNGIPCRENETLAPVVIDDDFRDYLKELGLNWSNSETWHFPRCGEGVPVAFVQIKKNELEHAMKLFNNQVSRFLKRFQKDEWSEFDSIENMLEAAGDYDRKGYDPTGTTEEDDNYMLEMAFTSLLEDLNKLDPTYARIIQMLRDGAKKGEILAEVNLGTEKSQGYAFIAKVQAIAREIWDKNNR
jgi:hypothetical protein